MATVQRYVNTASSGGDGTTNGTAGGTAAYASLSSWEANQSPSGTDDLVVDCCGTAADTTGVTCDWSTAPASVTIRGNASDPAGKYNGSALISTAHYRLAVASGSALMLTEATDFTVDGLQVEASGGSFRAAIGINTAAAKTYTIQNNRCRGSSSTRTGIGMPGSAVGFDGQTIHIRNNLISGFDVAQIELLNGTFRSPTWNIYQNTLYGDGASNLILANQDASGSPVVNIKNNCGWNSGGSAELNVTGTGTKNYDENAFQDGNGTTNEITLTSSAAAWVSAGTGQSADFTPATGSQLLGAGATGLSITTDINGTTRDSPPDIGAVEVAAGGGGALTGSSDATSGATGTLKGTGALAGTSAATSGATGTLSSGATLSGTSAATSGATGTLTGAGAVSGTSAVTSGSTGTLKGVGALAGTSAATSGATGTLAALAAGAVSGTVSVTSGATGTLRGAGALVGSVPVTSGAIGALIVNAPSIIAATPLAGEFDYQTPLRGTFDYQTSLRGTVRQ